MHGAACRTNKRFGGTPLVRISCALVGLGVAACLCEPGRRQAGSSGTPVPDEPLDAYPVWAVFMGCTPLPEKFTLPPCPQGARLTCRGNEYWCRKSDGTKHGFFMRLYASASKLAQLVYVDGVRHGPWSQWYQDGRRNREGRYARGEKQGIWQGWYPDGGRHYLHEYHQGYRHGRWARWTRDGRMEEEGYYHFGRRDGRWTQFFPDGGRRVTEYVDDLEVKRGASKTP